MFTILNHQEKIKLKLLWDSILHNLSGEDTFTATKPITNANMNVEKIFTLVDGAKFEAAVASSMKFPEKLEIWF